MKPSAEFLESLQVGDRVLIHHGQRMTSRARITFKSERTIIAKFGKETRRFNAHDGGTMYAPSSSKCWLGPVEE
ncbi:hypothetical protein [Pseudomonas tohonis]|uniref:hypothetical protein n=1 Tax=Pseudomonas tohonis TaxID=2725477 RepID=UPI001F314E0C|nr:hypothetical protein [Pseudomonas tohonis]